MLPDRLAAIGVFNILHRVFNRLVEGIPQDYVNRCKYDRYKRPAERKNGCIFLYWKYLYILPDGVQVQEERPANSEASRLYAPKFCRLVRSVLHGARSATPLSSVRGFSKARRPYISSAGKLLRKTYFFPSYFGENCVIITSRRIPKQSGQNQENIEGCCRVGNQKKNSGGKPAC